MEFTSTKYRTIIGKPGPDFDAQINELLDQGYALHNKGFLLENGDLCQSMVLKVASPSAAALNKMLGGQKRKPQTTTAKVTGPPPQKTVPVRPAFPAGSIGNGGRA
jgi:hypothetical protein